MYSNGNIIYHEWTKTPQLIPRTYMRDSIQPTSNMKRKVTMYPEPKNIKNPSYFLCIDFANPADLDGQVHVPVYPREQDTVCVKGTGNELWYGLVQDVDRQARKLTVQWYAETRRQGIWFLSSQQEDIIRFSSIMNLCNVKRTFGGYSIS